MLLVGLFALAQVPVPLGPAGVTEGPVDHTAVDLWRPEPGAEKLLVPVSLPDGSTELFLVDTGAATSVVHAEVAERLGLAPAVDAGWLQGLGGRVPWQHTRVPRMRLGEFELTEVDVAVGVQGVPERLGALPVAGILGNNVWANFVMVLDYPADRLELYRPDAAPKVRRSAPMRFDGRGIQSVVRVVAKKDGERRRADLLLEVDTGAHDVLFMRETGEPFRELSTVGEEPILGVGSDLDALPHRELMQITRRVPVVAVRIGGRRVPVDIDARWLCADTDCPTAGLLPGLVGFEVLEKHRVVLDFPHQRLALQRSRGPARQFDALAAWLAEDIRVHADDPSRAELRADVLWALRDREGAARVLEAATRARPDDVKLAVTWAWVLRSRGEWERANAVLAAFDDDALVEERAWRTLIGGMVLQGRVDEALALAQAAVEGVAEPGEERLVALSDALLAAGRIAEAQATLEAAARASPRGEASHLLRRARIALAAGDRYGAIVSLRELMDRLPLQGIPMWLYATLTEPQDRETFRADLDRALARLHPGDEPWDFVGAALIAVGDASGGAAALARGRARDCDPLPPGGARDNCLAWYDALAGTALEQAEARIQAALAEDPGNPSFRDTAAVVAAARGRAREAAERARHAARIDPDDAYLLWQLARLEAAAARGGS